MFTARKNEWKVYYIIRTGELPVLAGRLVAVSLVRVSVTRSAPSACLDGVVQRHEPVVGQFARPPTVDDHVAALELAVALDRTVVQVLESLQSDRHALASDQ